MNNAAREGDPDLTLRSLVAHFSGDAFADDVCIIAAELNPIERTMVASITGM